MQGGIAQNAYLLEDSPGMVSGAAAAFSGSREVKEYLNQRAAAKLIRGGADGIFWMGTVWKDEEDTLVLCAEYEIEALPVPGMFHSIRIVQKRTVRGWTGFTGREHGSGTGRDKVVYVTEHGTVYHQDAECRHLKLSVRQCSLEEAKAERNTGGAKYYPCERCWKEGSRLVYLTEDRRPVSSEPELFVSDQKNPNNFAFGGRRQTAMFRVRRRIKKMYDIWIEGAVTLLLMVNAVYDWRKREVSLPCLLASGGAGLVMNCIWGYQSLFSLCCGAGIGVFLSAVSFLTGGALGFGDGLLLCTTGLFLGGRKNFQLLFLGALLCAVVLGIGLLLGKTRWKQRFPFVPFLLAAQAGRLVFL